VTHRGEWVWFLGSHVGDSLSSGCNHSHNAEVSPPYIIVIGGSYFFYFIIF
jgi:hypothetical protein